MSQEAIEARIRQLTESWRKGYSLPQAFYLSPEIYQHDLERMLLRHWICAGHESSIPAPGDYFLFEMDRESVIIMRGHDGIVRALMNVCRHRGSRICSRESGHASSGVIACPYHAWVYKTDGSLHGARMMPAGFDKSAHSLAQIELRIIAGLIFINFSKDPLGLDAVTETIDSSLKVYGWDRAKVIHQERYLIDANWKLCIENQMECYHCAPSHRDYSRLHSQAKPGVDEFTDRMLARTGGFGLDIPIQDHWALEAREGQEAGYCRRYALSGTAVTASEDGAPVAPVMGDFPDYDGGTTFVYVGPLCFFLAYTDYGAIFRFIPKRHDQTELIVTWLVDSKAREGVDFDRDKVTWLWRITSASDKKIIEDNQLGVSSRFYQPGPYAFPIEASSHRFVEWYLHDVNGHGDR
jgi:phenylpropionate dioxygenase-like ring-hydroxylating dioxygenase large terminal subunit